MKRVFLSVLFACVTTCAQTGPFGIATIAGSPYDPTGENGPAIHAATGLSGVAFRDGNLYLTDGGNRIRKVGPNGIITTIAGQLDAVVHQPIPGYFGDGGPALSARVNGVSTLEFDAAGNLYMGDVNNACVRKLTARVVGGLPQPFDGTEIITTFAGTCTFIGNSGDNFPATSAELNFPRALAFDPASGALYIADYINNNIRKVLNGIITTVAGSAAAGFADGPVATAQFNGPAGVAVDPATDDLYIADLGNNRIRRLSNGIVTTIAGTGISSLAGNLKELDAAIAANVRPFKIRIASGILYFSDVGVNSVRTINLSTGIITTLAGNNLTTGPLDDGVLATAALIKSESEIALDGQGGVFILDGSTKRARYAAGPAVTILNQTVAAGTIQTVEGPPSAVTFLGDLGPALSALLFNPGALVADSNGNIFVVDATNNRVRQLDPSRTINTIAGSGVGGFSLGLSTPSGPASSGPALSAAIQPGSLVQGPDALYLSSNGSHALKLSAGLLSIVANLAGATSQPSHDGTTAVDAHLSVGSLVFDTSGNLYIADGTNSRIVRIDSTQKIKVIAGTGSTVVDGTIVTAAPVLSALISPSGLVFDPSGNLYFADSNQNRIFKITAHSPNQPLDGTETLTFFAGTGLVGFGGDGGPATLASFSYARGFVFDNAGNLYLNDGNFRIRVVNTQGIINTVAGTGNASFSGDGGPALLANIRGGNLAFDTHGNLFMTDGVNQVIRVLDNTPPTLTFQAPVPAANANGWNNTSVSIPFTASDTGAGVALTDPAGPLVLSSEGAAVSGVVKATDRAGNSATFTSPVVRIDKTAPIISGMPTAGCSVGPPNGKMVQVAIVNAFDALSGVVPASFQVTGTSNEPPSAPEISITPNGLGGYVIALQAAQAGKGDIRIYTLTATASDQAGNTVIATALCVTPPPPPLNLMFPSGPGANGTVGTPYSSSFTAMGGVQPYTFSITAGTLPAGLTLNASTGAVTGTPTKAANGPAAQLTARVVDLIGDSATQNGNINIAPPPPLHLQFPAGPTGNGTVGTPYSGSFSAMGGIQPYTFSIVAGTLPPGLTLNAATGAITGTPTTAVNGPAAQLTARVVDSTGASTTQNGNINIAPPPPLHLQFPAGPTGNGKVGTPYSSSFAATGGIQPYTFSIAAGTLPAGLTLNAATGAVTGTPTTAVNGPAAQLTARVVDLSGASATQNGNINIAP